MIYHTNFALSAVCSNLYVFDRVNHHTWRWDSHIRKPVWQKRREKSSRLEQKRWRFAYHLLLWAALKPRAIIVHFNSRFCMAWYGITSHLDRAEPKLFLLLFLLPLFPEFKAKRDAESFFFHKKHEILEVELDQFPEAMQISWPLAHGYLSAGMNEGAWLNMYHVCTSDWTFSKKAWLPLHLRKRLVIFSRCSSLQLDLKSFFSLSLSFHHQKSSLFSQTVEFWPSSAPLILSQGTEL